MRRLYLLTLALLLGAPGIAQMVLSPLNPLQTQLIRADLASGDEITPTGYAPFLLSSARLDSVLDVPTEQWNRRKYESLVMRKLKNEHLFEVHTDGFMLQGDAAFHFEAMPNTDDEGRRLFTNSRGYSFQGAIGERIFFQTSFYETQSIFPTYMDSVVFARGDFNSEVDPERGSVPGYGRWKPFNTSDSYDYDYQLATGSFGVRFLDRSFLQFGHDKQFLGYGFRSIFLSDASSPYTFLRAHINLLGGKISYSTTWAVLQSLDRITDKPYAKKEIMFRRLGARFSYLSFQPRQWISLGIFDGTTWTWRANSSPELEYYSPHAWLYTGNGIRNHLSGLNGQITLAGWLQGYGQYGYNWRSGGQALQIGAQAFGPVKNMLLQVEYNKVGQSFYFFADDSTGTVAISEPLQTGTQPIDYYQHNDLMLGHPLGVALDEVIIKARYVWRDILFDAAYHYIQLNTVQNPATIQFTRVEVGYLINPKSNMQLVGGLIYRTESRPSRPLAEGTYPYIALKTNLFNRYTAF